MAVRQFFFRGLIVTLALAAIFANYIAYTRPWFLQWGATPAELTRALPGDEIIPNAGSQYTRAITISAPVGQVWPWLAQLGQDRGGFYSFDLLENIVGCEMPVDDVLHPAKQMWQEGDRLWMYPKEKAGGVGFATLRTYVSGRAMGFATRALGTTLDKPEDGSWSFVLEPVDEGSTRFLIRGRLAPGRSFGGRVFDAVVVGKKRAEYATMPSRSVLFREALDALLSREGKEALRDFDGLFFIYAGARVPSQRGGLYWPHRSSLNYGSGRWAYFVCPEGDDRMSSISVKSFCNPIRQRRWPCA